MIPDWMGLDFGDRERRKAKQIHERLAEDIRVLLRDECRNHVSHTGIGMLPDGDALQACMRFAWNAICFAGAVDGSKLIPSRYGDDVVPKMTPATKESEEIGIPATSGFVRVVPVTDGVIRAVAAKAIRNNYWLNHPDNASKFDMAKTLASIERKQEEAEHALRDSRTIGEEVRKRSRSGVANG